MKLHEMIVDGDEEREAWNYEEHNALLERYPTAGEPILRPLRKSPCQHTVTT